MNRFVARAFSALRTLQPIHWAVSAVVLLALILRVYGLGAESLWLDELTTLSQTTWPPGQILAESVFRGTPPLYYLLQLLFYKALPASEASLRLLSAIADVVSVYLVFAVGRRLIGDWAALMAALFSAVSIRLLWFAQEARAYSLGMMLSLLLALTLLRLIEQPGWRRAVVHLLVAVALLYTHVYSTFALIGIELAVLLSPRLLKRLGRYWLAAAIAAAVSYIPWVVAIVSQISLRSELADTGDWSLEAPKGLLTPVITAISDLAPGVYRTIPYQGPSNWATPLFVALVIYGVLGRQAFGATASAQPGCGVDQSALTTWERRILLLSWGGMLLLGGVIVSQRILPIYSWRMATQAAPVVFIAAASGLRQLWRPAALVSFAVFVALTVSGLTPYYVDSGPGQTFEKEDWRGALRYARANAGPDTSVLVTTHWFVGRLKLYEEMLGYDMPQMTGIQRGLEASVLSSELSSATSGTDRAVVMASHVPVGPDGLTDVERGLESLGWHKSGQGSARAIILRLYER